MEEYGLRKCQTNRYNIGNKMRIYQIWISDFPLSDDLIYWDQALEAYQWYKELGYKDVKIVDTTTTQEKK